MSACDDCLRRAWLVAALAGRLQRVGGPPVVRALLALDDAELVAALAGGERGAPIRAGHRAFDPAHARERCRAAGLEAACRCDRTYPAALRDLEAVPAVLHSTSLPALEAATAEPAVALVGARRASTYGLEVARALGRDLGAARAPVISGLALGVDGAAHRGALGSAGSTVAVLAGGADVPYPPSHSRLYRQIAGAGTVVSELPPGTRAFPWCFPARNRVRHLFDASYASRRACAVPVPGRSGRIGQSIRYHAGTTRPPGGRREVPSQSPSSGGDLHAEPLPSCRSVRPAC